MFESFDDYNDMFSNDKKIGGFTPENGKTVIRILPSWVPGTKKIMKKAGYHAHAGQYCNCPRKIADNPCPICEYSSMLWRQGNKEGSRQFRAIERYYSNIIIRGREDLGVQKYGCGKRLAEKIINFITVSLRRDITDPQTGNDIVLIKEVNAGGYPSYDQSYPVYEPSPLGKEIWLNQLHDLDQEFPIKSYGELQTILQGWLNPVHTGIAGGISVSTAEIITAPGVVTPDRDEAMRILNNVR